MSLLFHNSVNISLDC